MEKLDREFYGCVFLRDDHGSSGHLCELHCGNEPRRLFYPDLGYRATVELDDGSYVTVYYRIVDGDGKPSIVYTKWKTTEGGKT